MRRYLGCKTRLLGRIADVVAAHCPSVSSVLDLFAGTGVVGQVFNARNRRVVVNDFLPSNAAVLTAFFTAQSGDRPEIERVIRHLARIGPDRPNYYSSNYGDLFFTEETARTIGAIRAEIERMALRPVVKAAALASLLYAADACALTCGHFDAYRGLKDRAREFVLRLPAIPYEENQDNEVHCRDGNELARYIPVDLVYIDPPYNARQYGTLYHVLDNIVQDQKPSLQGKTRKPLMCHRPQSAYCSARAATALADLLAQVRARHIIVSYNNMTSGGPNSNVLVARAQVEEMLGARGETTTYSIPFPSFTARRGLMDGHQEYLFYCRVTTPPAGEG